MWNENTKVILKKAFPFVAAGFAVGMAVGTEASRSYYQSGSSEKPANFYSEGLQAMRAAKYEMAAELFQKSLDRNSDDPVSRFGLGWAQQMKGSLDQALGSYQQSVLSGSDALHRSYFNMGVILHQKKKFAEAAMA